MSKGRKTYAIEWTGPQKDAVEVALRLRVETLEDERRLERSEQGCDLEWARIESEVLSRALEAIREATQAKPRRGGRKS